MRGYAANGEFSDLTYVRRPCDDRTHFQEVLAVLATAAGNPPRSTISDFSKASIHIIDDEFLDREPREVMEELLGYVASTQKEPGAD